MKSRFKKLFIIFGLLQVWAIMLALTIEKSLEMIVLQTGLSDVDFILLMVFVWGIISFVIYAFYRDVTYLKSLEGLADHILSDEDVIGAKNAMRKVKQNKALNKKETEFVKVLSDVGLLPDDFVDVYVHEKLSIKQRLQLVWVLVLVWIVSLTIKSKSVEKHEHYTDQ